MIGERPHQLHGAINHEHLFVNRDFSIGNCKSFLCGDPAIGDAEETFHSLSEMLLLCNEDKCSLL
jgi:hypothetical protein